jgi:hypothetical protein
MVSEFFQTEGSCGYFVMLFLHSTYYVSLPETGAIQFSFLLHGSFLCNLVF